jgi:hypothetical protein
MFIYAFSRGFPEVKLFAFNLCVKKRERKALREIQFGEKALHLRLTCVSRKALCKIQSGEKASHFLQIQRWVHKRREIKKKGRPAPPFCFRSRFWAQLQTQSAF